jgi:hypothetical protein
MVGMALVSDSSLLRSSGQTWKVAVCLAGVAMGIVMMGYGLAESRANEHSKLTLVGVALGFGALVLASWSVRCKACGMRWMWAALREQSCARWLNWLLAQCVCPRCGDDPASPRAHE